jgi:hypothetical protein
MFRFKTPLLLVTLGLLAPVYSYAANFCIAVGGGFGSGGTSFIAPGFALPTAGKCKPWNGFTKTASTVVLFSTGTGCLSSDSMVLTFSITSIDPSFSGSNVGDFDQIEFCPAGVKSCPIGSGNDQGAFSGTAKSEPCTPTLLKLPSSHA